jgi:hypothetical protein
MTTLVDILVLAAVGVATCGHRTRMGCAPRTVNLFSALPFPFRHACSGDVRFLAVIGDVNGLFRPCTKCGHPFSEGLDVVDQGQSKHNAGQWLLLVAAVGAIVDVVAVEVPHTLSCSISLPLCRRRSRLPALRSGRPSSRRLDLVLPEHLHRNPLGIRVREDGEGLHQSVRELALAAGEVVAKSILVPHHLRTTMAEERNLLRPTLRFVPGSASVALHRRLHSISLSCTSV